MNYLIFSGQAKEAPHWWSLGWVIIVIAVLFIFVIVNNRKNQKTQRLRRLKRFGAKINQKE